MLLIQANRCSSFSTCTCTSLTYHGEPRRPDLFLFLLFSISQFVKWAYVLDPKSCSQRQLNHTYRTRHHESMTLACHAVNEWWNGDFIYKITKIYPSQSFEKLYIYHHLKPLNHRFKRHKLQPNHR